MRPAEPYLGQLWQFAREVLLPALPRLAGWVLGLAAFSRLNILLLDEFWPHSPAAEYWFNFLLIGCLVLLPWLGAYTAQRVRQRVTRWWWRTLWQLIVFGAYAVAAMSLGFLFISLMFSHLLYRR